MDTLALVLTAYLAFQMASTGGFKLAALTAPGQRVALVMTRQRVRDRLLVAPWFWNLTGAWEVALAAGALAGLWIPALAMAAGLLAAGTMLVALVFHARARDHRSAMLPALLVLAVALTVAVLHALRLTSS
jgi:hypothetical protein